MYAACQRMQQQADQHLEEFKSYLEHVGYEKMPSQERERFKKWLQQVAEADSQGCAWGFSPLQPEYRREILHFKLNAKLMLGAIDQWEQGELFLPGPLSNI